MRFAQSTKFRLANLLIIIPLLWMTGVCPCLAQQPDKQETMMGELKLEGKYIDRLVLRSKNGRTHRLDHPDEIITLPVGEYRLKEAYLIDGYSCSRVASGEWVTINADMPAVLKLGAPLKQTVKIKRQGSVLVLNYELLGQGGENYTSSSRSKPPTFAIYKGDKEIASDKFEFG